MLTLKEQLDCIRENISNPIWSQKGFDYYELLTKLHLLLVKNNLRKSYYDETTLVSCKYFENCSDDQIDDIIIEHVPDFKPRINALNQLKKISEKMGLQTYLIRQIPIEIRTKCYVPENIIKKFATSFSCGKQILIFNDKKIESEIRQLLTGKKRLGDILEYPRCCVNWMVETKTKSLEDCYKFYEENFGTEDHDKMKEFLLKNFESDNISGNKERMIEIQDNHVMRTISTYPFVFHQACNSCLKNSYSSTSKLNKKYSNFAKKISKEFHDKILDEAKRIWTFKQTSFNKRNPFC